MKRTLLQENLILNKELFDEYFDNARRKGILSIANEKGRAEMNRGIYQLNYIPDFSKDTAEAKNILWRLIHKYGQFEYTANKFQSPTLSYELEKDSDTWMVYNVRRY